VRPEQQTTDEVERLAAEFDEKARHMEIARAAGDAYHVAWCHGCGRPISHDASEIARCGCERPIGDVRALVAERDKAEAERDAALARAQAAETGAMRLQRGWLRVIQAENSCAVTGRPCDAKRCGCEAEREILANEAAEDDPPLTVSALCQDRVPFPAG